MNQVTDITQMLPAGFGEVQLSTMFEEEQTKRSHLESRWEDYAGWTLPYVFPMEGHTESLEMQTDYQSTGAKAVNALTNKLASTLFTHSRPFFRLEVSEEMAEQAVKRGIEPADLEELTSATEKAAMKEMDKVGLRTAILSAVRSLIVTGNSLLFLPPGGKLAQTYSLKDYIIKRNLSGEDIVIITRDRKSLTALPKDLADQVRAQGITDPDAEVSLFTGIFRTEDNRFVVKQEIDKLFVVPAQKGVYTKENLLWIPLTWNLVRGMDYGNGLVEDYSGAFGSLSSLSESMHSLVAISADIKLLVDPMGQTDVKTLNDSPPGTAVYGSVEDVAFLQLEKQNDLNFISSEMDALKREIGQGFLIASAGQRDAERVTTVEIERDALELEESLGGIYSRLALELQHPVAIRLLASLDNNLTELEVQVITGVDALSRKSDLEAMRMLLDDLGALNVVPEDVRAWFKIGPTIKLFAAHRHVDYSSFLKSQDERDAEIAEEQAREAELIAQEQAAKQQGQAGPQ